MVRTLPFRRGDLIHHSLIRGPLKFPEEEFAVLTKPNRQGMYWIRLRHQWLLVIPFTDLANGHESASLAVIEAKERW